jgi:hypothetical protein
MVIYTNGCSHTAGYCIKRHQTWPHMIAYNIIGDNYSKVKVIKDDLNIILPKAYPSYAIEIVRIYFFFN